MSLGAMKRLVQPLLHEIFWKLETQTQLRQYAEDMLINKLKEKQEFINLDANNIFCLALERCRRPTRNSSAIVKHTITKDPRVALEKARIKEYQQRIVREGSKYLKHLRNFKKNAALIIDTYLSVISNEVDNEDYKYVNYVK